MASIVMLAFVVFPHHHHNEYICFATAHCQDEGENEEHSHDTGSSNHRCVKNLFQTQINRGQNGDTLLINRTEFYRTDKA